MEYNKDAGEEIDVDEAYDILMPDVSEADQFRGRSYEEHDSVAPGELAFELYGLVESDELNLGQARDIYEEVTSKEYRDRNQDIGLGKEKVPGERAALLVEDELEVQKLEEEIEENNLEIGEDDLGGSGGHF